MVDASGVSSPAPDSGTSLDQAIKASRTIWIRDLRALFEHAQDRFTDVKWSNTGDSPAGAWSSGSFGIGKEQGSSSDDIFGHKAIVYARAPKGFKDRFFPSISASRSPIVSPYDSETHLSSTSPGINISSVVTLNTENGRGRSSSAASNYSIPASARNLGRNTTLLQLSDCGTPELIRTHLEWFYTSEGVGGDVVGWLSGEEEEEGDPLHSDLDGGEGYQGLGCSISMAGTSEDARKISKIGDEADRHEKLGQDLIYMWRSKLYADIKIRLPINGKTQTALHLAPPSAFRTGNRNRNNSFTSLRPNSRSGRNSTTPSVIGDGDGDGDGDDDEANVVSFSAHRFLLCSRSPYFAQVLLNGGAFAYHPASSTISVDKIPEVTLPSPPFTPIALHFILGYMYSGSLDFSHRTFDLSTAFAVYRAAIFLELDPLVDEVEARITWEFCDGMSGTRTGKRGSVNLANDWSNASRRKCGRRVPRVWRFAMAPDVGAVALAAKAESYIISYWGDCLGREIASAETTSKERIEEHILDNISIKTTLEGYRKLMSCKKRMNGESTSDSADSWQDIMQEMIETIETHLQTCLLGNFAVLVEQAEFRQLLDPMLFDTEVLEVVLESLTEGAGRPSLCEKAPKIYQDLVGALLTGVDPDTDALLLPAGTRARALVETAKETILSHIKRRWMQIKAARGFNQLSFWALKEISDEIEVPIEDLLEPEKKIMVASRSSMSLSSPKLNAQPGDTSVPRVQALRERHASAASRRSEGPTSPRISEGLPRSNATSSPRARITSSASRASVHSTALSSTPLAGPSSRNGNSTGARPSQAQTVPAVPSRSSAAAVAAVTGPTASPSDAASLRSSTTTRTINTTATTVRKPAGVANTGRVSAAVQRLGATHASASSALKPSTLAGRLATQPVTSTARPIKAATSNVQPVMKVATNPILSSRGLAETRSLRSRSSLSSIGGEKGRQHTMSQSTVVNKVPVKEPSSVTAGRTGLGPSDTRSVRAMSTRSGFSVRDAASSSSVAINKAFPKSVAPAPSGKVNASPAALLKPVSQRVTRAPAKSAAGTGPRPSFSPTKQGSVSSLRTFRLQSSASTEAKSKTELPRSRLAPSIYKTTPSGPRQVTPLDSSTAGTISKRIPVSVPKAVGLPPKNTLGQQSTPGSPSLQQHDKDSSQSTDVTEDAEPEAITPAASEHEGMPSPRIIRVTSSSGSDATFSGLHPTEIQAPLTTTSMQTPSTQKPKMPPSAMPLTVFPGRRRTVSSASSTHSRGHPAHAFDPPDRVTPFSPAIKVDDGTIPPSDESGVQLKIGIPCIVSLKERKARFKALCLYIGKVEGLSGPWVGVEVADYVGVKYGIEGLCDGSANGIRYFDLSASAIPHPNTPNKRRWDQVSRDLAEGRPLERRPMRKGSIPSSFPASVRGNRSIYDDGPMSASYAESFMDYNHSSRDISRSASPIHGESGGEGGSSSWIQGAFGPPHGKSRGLFVRPSEVVFVMGAAE